MNADALRQQLLSWSHPEGGWGYQPERSAHLEPTALAVLALGSCERAVPFWQLARQPDGSFRLPLGRVAATWGTAQTLFALAQFGEANHAWLEPAGKFLLHLRGRTVDQDPEITDLGAVNDVDSRLVGWPWAADNFSWVEPTSWAMIALSRLGWGGHERVAEGAKLLINRIFPSGGVNYGNRMILGKSSEPLPGPTALMLLALQNYPDVELLQSSLSYLLHSALETEDIEHLAWGKLACSLYLGRGITEGELGQLDEQLLNAITARTQRHWVWPSVVRTALAAMALVTHERHPFRLPAQIAGPALPTKLSVPELKPPLVERIQTMALGVLARGLDSLRQYPPRSPVHIAKAPSYAEPLLPILKEQYGHFRESVPLAGKRVVLKPNLVEYYRHKVINTHPAVIEAAIELCKAEGAAEIVVAEGTGHWRNLEFLVHASGLGEVLERQGVRFVDLNHDEASKQLNLGRCTGLDHLYLSRTVANAEVLISMPKLKTHHWAVTTLSLKNLFGLLPGIAYGWPKNELHWRGIPNSIVDIACTQTPQLAILDGIMGMEGDGPLNGVAKEVGLLFMSSDLVALDATASRIMGFDPARIPYIWLANQKRLGRLDADSIEQLGLSVAESLNPFAPPPRLEKLLMPVG